MPFDLPHVPLLQLRDDRVLVREPAAITIPPQAAARVALAQLGHRVASHGHWRHGLLAAWCSTMPAKLRNRVFLSTALEMAAVERAKEG